MVGVFRAIRRLLSSLFVVWGVVSLVFLIGRVLPGDAAALASGPVGDPEILEATRGRLGLDEPLYRQYGIYLSELVRGDFGVSLISRQPVLTELAARLPASLELILTALLLSVIAGGALAVLGAKRRGGFFDRLGAALSVAGVALPSFLIGVLLVLVFFLLVPIAPAPLGRIDIFLSPPREITGFLVLDSLLSADWRVLGSAISHLVLPAISLALPTLAPLLRILRPSIASALASDGVQAARLAGVPPGRLWVRYLLPLASLPSLHLLASTLGYLLSGAVLVERIFGWNGVGSYAVEAIQRGDYPAIQGFVLAATLIYVIGFFLVDTVTWLVDPRTRVPARSPGW